MAPQTNYSRELGDREPLAAIRDTVERLSALTAHWTPSAFERSSALGKWTARQVVVHLAQTELALGVRARMALATANYSAQNFDQDAWLVRETGLSGSDGVAAFTAIARMNLAFFAALSAADRETAMSHPEYRSITVDWIIYTLAGHQIHHLKQLESLSIPISSS